MTSALKDPTPNLRFSPYGTALRHRRDGRLLGIMSVVEVRISTHADEWRPYRIDNEDLHNDELLADQEGVLGGRPAEGTCAQRGVILRQASAGR